MLIEEDELSVQLLNDIVRTMRKIPDQLGKKTDRVAQIEEKIQKRIPEWLENNPIPNIANTAKQNHEKAEAEVNAEANKKEELVKEQQSLATDLFDENVTEVKDPKPETPKEDKKKDDFEDELFVDDADLFGDK
jgi:hypothetical protein